MEPRWTKRGQERPREAKRGLKCWKLDCLKVWKWFSGRKYAESLVKPCTNMHKPSFLSSLYISLSTSRFWSSSSLQSLVLLRHFPKYTCCQMEACWNQEQMTHNDSKLSRQPGWLLGEKDHSAGSSSKSVGSSQRRKWRCFLQDRSGNLCPSWHECLPRQSPFKFWRPAKQPVYLHWLDWLTSLWARGDCSRQTHRCIWNPVPWTQRESDCFTQWDCFTQCCTKYTKWLQAYKYTFLGHPKFQPCQVAMNSFRIMIMAVMEIVVAAVKTPNSWRRLGIIQPHPCWAIKQCLTLGVHPIVADHGRPPFLPLWISSKPDNIPQIQRVFRWKFHPICGGFVKFGYP